jgi:glucose-1-phosphate cytidylyltransferase
MKTVILAGGRGTRIADLTQDEIPKPMLKIGDAPMLEHIMRIYAKAGHKEFVIATGHKKKVIEDWLTSQGDAHMMLYGIKTSAVFTGVMTQTAGRLMRLKQSGDLESETFMMTYGDGVADINFKALLEFHGKAHAEKGTIVTLSAVRPPARFGNIEIENGVVTNFGEKTQMNTNWINGGFFVIHPLALNLIEDDMSRWEYEVLPVLAVQGRLAAYQHPGFFQMCDTWRDYQLLQKMWRSGEAPWARNWNINQTEA